MDVLIHMSSREATGLAVNLADALTRRGADWACFLTNDAVTAADTPAFVEAVKSASRAVVCEHSWDQHMTGRDNPFERGSQTINSALMAEADRVVSL